MNDRVSETVSPPHRGSLKDGHDRLSTGDVAEITIAVCFETDVSNFLPARPGMFASLSSHTIKRIRRTLLEGRVWSTAIVRPDSRVSGVASGQRPASAPFARQLRRSAESRTKHLPRTTTARQRQAESCPGPGGFCRFSLWSRQIASCPNSLSEVLQQRLPVASFRVWPRQSSHAWTVSASAFRDFS